MKKNACIAGVTGQGGAYRAELLLRKGYEVHGIKRRASSFNTDSSNLIRIIELAELAAAELGLTLSWSGAGESEIGTVSAVTSSDDIAPMCKVGNVIVRVDPRYFRPTKVKTLLGDPTKAREKLGRVPTTTLQELVCEMVQAGFAVARRDALVKNAGFQTLSHHE